MWPAKNGNRRGWGEWVIYKQLHGDKVWRVTYDEPFDYRQEPFFIALVPRYGSKQFRSFAPISCAEQNVMEAITGSEGKDNEIGRKNNTRQIQSPRDFSPLEIKTGIVPRARNAGDAIKHRIPPERGGGR